MRLSAFVLTLVTATGIGCGGLPGVGGGGGGGAYKPDAVTENQFGGDLTGAKTGYWMSYASDASGNKSTTKIIVVGDGWVEWWMDAGAVTFGHLFEIKDKKIVNAWAAGKGDKEWTKIKVNPPPTGGETPKSTIKDSDEAKEVKAGKFNCHRQDVTTTISGKDYKSTMWFAKDVWKLQGGSEHGGFVAMETEGMKMWLDGKGEDGKPTLEMPKK